MRKPWGLGVAVLAALAGIIVLAALRSGDLRARVAAARSFFADPGIPELDIPDAPAPRPEDARPPIEPSRDSLERQRRIERTVVIERATTVPELAQAGGWGRSLAVHHGLPRLAGPEAERKRLEETLAIAIDPVARQNVIFLAVLTLPTDVSHPWLLSLMTGGSGGDAEDALVALAFDGHSGARSRFTGLAHAPSRAAVHRLLNTWADHEELGQTGTEEARGILRSYRAIEVLDREPYFKITFHLVRHVAWLPHPSRTPDLDRELLAEWVARYRGHPGSDDMAVRLGRLETGRGEHMQAARWYSRAATMPDQDMCDVAVEDLVATCEILLTPEELDLLANDSGYETPNRTLVRYIRLRRIAVERGFDRACWEAEGVAHDEPLTALGYSWIHRNAAPAPKGLDSGLAPAPPDDPLRAVAASPPPLERPDGSPPPVLIPTYYLGYAYDDETARLSPCAERLQINEAVLMRQFRVWETIATLELRAAQAAGDVRADLLYKIAAVLYHDPRACFPAYGTIVDFRDVFRHVTGEGPKPGSFGSFVQTSYPLLRAIRAFERIERDHPTYSGMDKVLFSEGLAWVKLNRFLCDAKEGGYGGQEERPDRTKIKNGVLAFERCAAWFPRSPLADDALRAVSYWRRTRPDAFK